MRDDDAGFTLIELLISITVMGIVLGVVTTAFVVGISATADTTQEVSQSQGTAFSSGNLTDDVASATAISTTVANCTGQSGVLAVALSWTDISTVVDVDYRFDSATGALTRYAWNGSTCGTPASQVVIASDLQSVSATQVTSAGARAMGGVALTLTGRLGTSQQIVAYRRVA